ncbi:MAG TPA: glycosyltransferase family 2 protein [Polyangiaceae bacterium]|nr:glycosyltransferase family 2 protein [Polyangiaceae bacterium]
MATFSLSLLALLVYTYAGYPLLVALCARAWPKPVRPRADYEPTVSVCVTAHNGAAFIEAKLKSLLALDYPREKLEILVYSDGSSDDTEAVTQRFAADHPRVRLLASSARLGKPTGVNRLRDVAQGEVLLMSDVRQALAPRALRALLEQLSDPDVGCASGSLVLAGETGAGAYWRYEKFIRGSEARLGSMVGVSGSLYAIRREDLPELPADLLLDDMFVPLSTLTQRKRIVMSTEAEAYDRAYGDEQEFGRKVRTLAGNYQLVALMPWLLLPFKNPVWFQLVSHKLLRLLCPFALLGLLSSTLVLASVPGLAAGERWFWLALCYAQLGFYGLALLGARAGRLGALARTFVVLNAAALVALWRFLTHTQSVAW